MKIIKRSVIIVLLTLIFVSCGNKSIIIEWDVYDTARGIDQIWFKYNPNIRGKNIDYLEKELKIFNDIRNKYLEEYSEIDKSTEKFYSEDKKLVYTYKTFKEQAK